MDPLCPGDGQGDEPHDHLVGVRLAKGWMANPSPVFDEAQANDAQAVNLDEDVAEGGHQIAVGAREEGVMTSLPGVAFSYDAVGANHDQDAESTTVARKRMTMSQVSRLNMILFMA
jgi:hypothetical protein